MQVWRPPAEILDAWTESEIVTGVKEEVVFPLPNWPEEFMPQHFTAPSVKTAQVCCPPALTCTALVIPETETGVLLVVEVPSPNRPEML